MDVLPDEIIYHICGYLQSVNDRRELSRVSKRIAAIVDESWLSFANQRGWKKDSESKSWKDICRDYFLFRKRWFTGKMAVKRLYFDSKANSRNKNVLTSLGKSGDNIGIGTESYVSCYRLEMDEKTSEYYSNQYQHLPMETAENSLCMSKMRMSAIDEFSPDLVISDLKSVKIKRVPLNTSVSVEKCHQTASHIIMIMDDGTIDVYFLDTGAMRTISEEKNEISFSSVEEDHLLIVSFWSKSVVIFDLFQLKCHPIFVMSLNYVLYSFTYRFQKSTGKRFLFFGSADGDVGKISITLCSENGAAAKVFPSAHTDSVYCTGHNGSVLASGGADGKVVFWSLDGNLLHSDESAHVGVVRHIFLNKWLMITAGDAREIMVWDPTTFIVRHVFHQNPIKVKFMLADETSVVYGSPDSKFVIFLSVNY